LPGRNESLARNETSARELNDRIEERVLLFSRGQTKFGIVCECDQSDCEQRIIVTASEYERVRQDPTLFFVLPGHEDKRLERIVSRESDNYLIVQKKGVAEEVAEEDR